jgi:hypothetical protein
MTDGVIIGVLGFVAVVFLLPSILQPATMIQPTRMKSESGWIRVRGIRDSFFGV